MSSLGIVSPANGLNQSCGQREGSLSIIERQANRHENHAELYRWFQRALEKEPIPNGAEEALWLLLTNLRREF